MSNSMRSLGTVSLAVTLVAVAAVALFSQSSVAGAAGPSTDVERGRYLVAFGGCNDCHTPLAMGPQGPAPDMTRMLSGHPAAMEMPTPPALSPDAPWNATIAATATAFAGPWGISYARNLTPDEETGLGKWTEEQFVRAMRTGKHLGHETERPILPPMPWMGVAQLTDGDLHALWSYLRSIPAVRNAAPASIPAPPPPAAEH